MNDLTTEMERLREKMTALSDDKLKNLEAKISMEILALSPWIAKADQTVLSMLQDITRREPMVADYVQQANVVTNQLFSLSIEIDALERSAVKDATAQLKRNVKILRTKLRDLSKGINKQSQIMENAAQTTFTAYHGALSQATNAVSSDFSSHLEAVSVLLVKEIDDLKAKIREPISDIAKLAAEAVADEFTEHVEEKANEIAAGLEERVEASVADARESLEDLFGEFDDIENEILDAAGVSEAESAALDEIRASLEEVFEAFQSLLEQLEGLA